MKHTILLVFGVVFAFSLPTLGDDWTTTDGRIYKDVVILSHDTKVVTINCSDGMATLPVASLNNKVQKSIREDHVTAKDWTINGKEYPDVVVGEIDPDRVQITYKGGTAFLMLSDLPPDLQKKFNYNPQAAAKAIAGRLAAQAQAQAAFAKEAEQHQADAQKAQQESLLLEKVEKSALSVNARIVRKPNDNSAIADYAYFIPDKGWYRDNPQILILGVPSDSVDGDAWSGTLYYAGIYKDSVSTMRRWATTKEEALRMLKESALQVSGPDGGQEQSQ